MSDAVIRVENISKKYILQHQVGGRSRYVALRDVLAHKISSLFRRNSGTDASREEFWALKDVSFDIKQGEAVGIIGRNGAGKSTLLKILSRITKPTQGRIEIEGRVASLLEVGTGFHPELTGRENIFLNGAILGMHRAEIKKKFDEIVAFAEVEKFLDTPVKRFSSGMYMRLAFAVAAHLEPEILVVDEVLAVGDVEFQKKCLGKMQDVSTQKGRTVLFVSHNMQAILQLCERAIFLEKGRVSAISSATECVRLYLSKATDQGSTINLDSFRMGAAGGRVKLQKCEYKKLDGTLASLFDRTEEIDVTITFQVKQPVQRLDFAMALITSQGDRVFSEVVSDKFQPVAISEGNFKVAFRIAASFFKPEPYFLTLWAFDFETVEDYVEGVPFPVITDFQGDPSREAKRWGAVRLPLSWQPIKPETT
jgi:lipopolysaccharide transport system ATP-binding protein